MNTPPRLLIGLVVTCWLSFIPVLIAQGPTGLLHSIPSPGGGAQRGPLADMQLGSSVAVDGALAVVGAPYDDLIETDSGSVIIYDSATGAAVAVLQNPAPAVASRFGTAVAISGTRVVVGVLYDDTGAPDAGSVYVFDLGSPTPRQPVAALRNPSPAQSDFFGNAVAISGSTVVVGAYRSRTGTVGAGTAYVYDLDTPAPTVPVGRLINPTPGLNDWFGGAVAISGKRVVVGAYGDSLNGSEAGSAYVFDLGSASPFTAIATLTKPAPLSGDWFGGSVAISGRFVGVGAVSDDLGMEHAGGVYVYDLDGLSPETPVATLTNPNPSEWDYFGHSIALSGTLMLVGTPYEDQGTAGNVGRTYVYDLSGGAPAAPLRVLSNPNPALADQFGWAAAIQGTRVVVGANWDDKGAVDAGSVYLFDLSAATPTVVVATLNGPGPPTGDEFGASVATSGRRVAVGAPANDFGKTDSGRVFVYDLQTAAPEFPVAVLNNPSTAANDQFGHSVSISGGLLVAGAANDDTGRVDAGSAYVYTLDQATPTVLATLNNPSPGANDHFGFAVAISGSRVVVGAPHDDTGSMDAGSAYVYDMDNANPHLPVLSLRSSGPAAGSNFGTSVAISGTRVVVGAPNGSEDDNHIGTVYVYDLGHASPTVPVAILENPQAAAHDEFGIAVAISGTLVVVGALDEAGGRPAAGGAYVYDLSSESPGVATMALMDPGSVAHGHFGESVAISGMHIVVGAGNHGPGATAAGSAYRYDLGSAAPTIPNATLTNPSPGLGDRFANAVALDGDVAVVGAALDDSTQVDNGSIYIFGDAESDADSDDDGLRDAWELSFWPTTSGHGALDDFDGDGYPELLEMAFGLNPTVSESIEVPAVTEEAGYLTITIVKQPGVAYEVQSAGTLHPGFPGSFRSESTAILLDTTVLKVRDTVKIGAAASRFMRVVVRGAP